VLKDLAVQVCDDKCKIPKLIAALEPKFLAEQHVRDQTGQVGGAQSP
jgi:hypothetical protein